MSGIQDQLRLIELIKLIKRAPDREAAMRLLLKAIIQLLGAERGFIALKNPVTGEFEFHVEQNITADAFDTIQKAIINEVSKSKQPLITTNAQYDSRFQQGESIAGFGLRSVIALPIQEGDEVTGVAYVDNRAMVGLFKQEDMYAVNTLAAAASSVSKSPPNFDEMSSEEIMQWMESLAKRQDAIDNMMKDSNIPIREEIQLLPNLSDEPQSSPPPKPQTGSLREPKEAEAEEGAAYDLDETAFGGAMDAAPPPLQPAPAAPPPPAPPAPRPPAEQGEIDDVLYRDIPDGLSEKAAAEAPPPPPQPQPTQPGGPAATQTGGTTTIQFSAYYPREVLPMEWNPLTAYVFRQDAADQVSEDAHRQLGPRLEDMRRVAQPARRPIVDGAQITATPYLDGFQFNPPSISIGFFEAWHRLDFKLRALPEAVNRASNGFLTFTNGGLIVADIPLSVFVTEAASQTVTPTPISKAYEAVFISYSRHDENIVRRAEILYRLIGADYMRDLLSLKAGEKWDEKLLEFIDKADIFQLFWSQAASQSDAVEKEWRHALNLSNQRPAFIRPVYWQQPLPDVPAELEHINFAYIPELSG